MSPRSAGRLGRCHRARAPRDNARWNYLGKKIFLNHLVAPSHEQHVAFLKTWIVDHLAWQGKNMPGACDADRRRDRTSHRRVESDNPVHEAWNRA